MKAAAIWEDAALPALDRARALLAAVEGGQGDLKRLGAWFDLYADDPLRDAVLAEATTRGADLPDDEARSWPGKKLLRRALARDGAAQIRTTPIRRDEDFTCMACKRDVPRHGRTARDHCPWCLCGRHVDDLVPGDRASTCGGRLDPVDLVVTGKGVDIRYRCTRCRAEKINQALLDGDVPDDWEALVKLSSGQLG